jgi:hypothetical protein
MREFHAPRVKILRARASQKISTPRFIGIFAEKCVGTGGAKTELVLAVSVSLLRPINCHLNKKQLRSVNV